jgi:response regulator RpfG family c-di-GMP phosphodiesterase
MVLTYVAGLGIILMIIKMDKSNYYYGGLFMVFALNFFLFRLKTIYSSITASFLIASFLVLSIFLSDIYTVVIVENTIFYASFCFIGVIGSRYFEQYRLNQFYQESIILGEKIVLEKQIYNQYENIKNYHTATIFTLAKLAESRDLLTGNHINRVSQLSYLLSKDLPESVYENNQLVKKDFLDSILLSSSLHDIGKIAISDIILNKPGKLTKEEFEIIKTHTTKGYDMLKEIEKDYNDNMFISLGLQISKSHHEKWDGTGYPEGLKGKKIPLAARIVAVVDVYDALVSERPYKPAFSKEKSLCIIKEGIGNHFDPAISKRFIKLMDTLENIEF